MGKRANPTHCLLRSNLAPFAAWLKTQGWAKEDPKGIWEALRMRHPDHAGVLLVWARGRFARNPDLLTLDDLSHDWRVRWVRAKQEAARG